MCLCSILGSVLSWLDGFIRTSGFAGLAALGAALIAFTGVRQNRDAEDRRAQQARWWEQARWAAECVREDTARGLVPGKDEELVVVQIALKNLVVAAKGTDGQAFALTLMERYFGPDVDTRTPGPDTQASDAKKGGDGSG